METLHCSACAAACGMQCMILFSVFFATYRLIKVDLPVDPAASSCDEKSHQALCPQCSHYLSKQKQVLEIIFPLQSCKTRR